MKKKLLAAALLPLLPGLAWSQPPTAAGPAAGPTAPATVPQAQGKPHPAIWLLSDADTRIYLFGTVHALRRDLQWRSVAFNRIAHEAEELVLEVSDRELATRGLNPFVVMQMSKSVPLPQRVSPDRRQGLARMLRELGIPEGGLDNLQTWGVAMLLGVAQIERQNWGERDGTPESEAASGVEAVLMREFRAGGRPISGAESGTALIAAFRRLRLDAQQAMLDEAVDAYINGEPTGAPVEADWVTGTLDNIARAIDALPPRLYEMLITSRNRNFADWLAQRLERPGTVLFAIGIGHLAGRVSVQSMLESRGLHVQRIY